MYLQSIQFPIDAKKIQIPTLIILIIFSNDFRGWWNWKRHNIQKHSIFLLSKTLAIYGLFDLKLKFFVRNLSTKTLYTRLAKYWGWKGIMVLVKSISFPATHWGISYGGLVCQFLGGQGLEWRLTRGCRPPPALWGSMVQGGPRGPGSTRPELIELCRTSAFAAVMLCMDSFSYCATRVNRAHNPFLLRFQA